MRAIMVMFDSLNRRFLEPYGAKETITPNFRRLAEKSVCFDNCYAGSLPCIPARRELHTGRYNFLHRSWGPLEPFDDSVFRILKENGIHTHLVSDHGHYWESGGATYHTQYTTWDCIRGQEGDPWAPALGDFCDEEPNFMPFTEELREKLYRQNLANRKRIKEKRDFPLIKTFDAGIDFLEKNGDEDFWFLQIESFSPHEPFMADKEHKNLYPSKEKGKRYEWPDYSPVKESKDEIDEVRYAYFSDLSMCDEQLGRILDIMDKKDMWKNTMLIVNTDHGFMLGEHGYWAKNYMPCYNEIVHIPLFIWNPFFPDKINIRRNSLVQTIDLPVTLLRFFGMDPEPDMQGRDLRNVIEKDEPVREWGLFGIFGAHICCTNGRYVYMRAPRCFDIPLFEYTLIPTHMMSFFSLKELQTGRWNKGFGFTKGVPVMRIQTDNQMRCVENKDLLFDLEIDPEEKFQIHDESIVKNIKQKMKDLMLETEAPKELYYRFKL